MLYLFTQEKANTSHPGMRDNRCTRTHRSTLSLPPDCCTSCACFPTRCTLPRRHGTTRSRRHPATEQLPRGRARLDAFDASSRSVRALNTPAPAAPRLHHIRRRCIRHARILCGRGGLIRSVRWAQPDHLFGDGVGMNAASLFRRCVLCIRS